MATIIRTMEDSTFVQYNEFTIIDEGGSGDPEASPYAESWEGRDITGEWLSAADNLLMVNSGYATHETRIQFELWDSDPGVDSSNPLDVDRLTTSFYSSSGSIVIDEMLGDKDHDSFELGPAEGMWHVRGHRFSQVPPGYFPESTEEELETYIFQFWPVTPANNAVNT